MMRFRTQGIVLGLAVLISGCAALPGMGPGPLDTFELTSPDVPAAGRRLGRRQVLIAEPAALKPLDSENIVIRSSATSLQYLAGAQWSDRLPKIVQSRLAEAFQSSGRLGGVGLPGQGLAVDYQIVTEIRAFEIRVGQGETAHVELAVKVLDDRNGVVRASKVFTASAPVSGAGNHRFADALDRAFAEIASELVPWALRAM